MQLFSQKSIINIPLSVLKSFIAIATQIPDDTFSVVFKYDGRSFHLERMEAVDGVVHIEEVPIRDEAFADMVQKLEKLTDGERDLVTASGVYYAITIHPRTKDVVINIGRA